MQSSAISSMLSGCATLVITARITTDINGNFCARAEAFQGDEPRTNTGGEGPRPERGRVHPLNFEDR
jgi:hypothetical protein